MSRVDENLVALVRLFSRLPLPADRWPHQQLALNQALWLIAPMGIILGSIAAAVTFVFYLIGVPALLLGLIWFAAMIALTGALHEDGLADVADGFWGGNDIARRLEIMKDSGLGSYGMLALLFSVLLRAGALGLIMAQASVWQGLLSAVIFAGVSRAMLTPLWALTSPARAEGLARHVGQPSRTAMGQALVTAAAISLALLFVINIGHWLMLAGALALLSAGFLRLVVAKIGGHTGDTLGAQQQLSECLLWVMLAGFTVS